MSNKPETHRVQPGDSLEAIALKHGTSIEELVRLNGISDPDYIEVDQLLKLREPDSLPLGPYYPVDTYEDGPMSRPLSYQTPLQSRVPQSPPIFSINDPSKIKQNCDANYEPPCAQTVTVKCHACGNTRAILSGGNELRETDQKIYFIADQFEKRQGVLQGNVLFDEATIEVDVNAACKHKVHTLTWTDGGGTHFANAGATTSIPFTVRTNPRSVLDLGIATTLHTLTPNQVALESVIFIIELLMNYQEMRNEEQFTISHDGGGLYSFTSVTIPMAKVVGSLSVGPPVRKFQALSREEGRQRRHKERQGAGQIPRLETTDTGWAFDCDVTFYVANTKRAIQLFNRSSKGTTLESNKAIKAKKNRSAFNKLTDALINSPKVLAGKVTAEESKDRLFDIISEGPALVVESGADLAEQQGGPGLSAKANVGLSIEYMIGLKINIWYALKQAVKRAGAQGYALIKVMEKLEDGFDWWIASGRVEPYLDLIFSLAFGSKRTEDGSGDANVSAEIDLLTGDWSGKANITGTAGLELTGGIKGEYDSIFTKKSGLRLFRFCQNLWIPDHKERWRSMGMANWS